MLPIDINIHKHPMSNFWNIFFLHPKILVSSNKHDILKIRETLQLAFDLNQCNQTV